MRRRKKERKKETCVPRFLKNGLDGEKIKADKRLVRAGKYKFPNKILMSVSLPFRVSTCSAKQVLSSVGLD